MGIGEIAAIEPAHVVIYLNKADRLKIPSRIALIRKLFDWLAAGEFVTTNPAASVSVLNTSKRRARVWPN
jgi:hypothetical protein